MTSTAAKLILAMAVVFAPGPAVSAQTASPALPSGPAVLPAPTGSYGVGVVTHAVNDPRRREIFTTDSSDIRRFPVFVFYPVAKGTCAPGPYFTQKIAEVYAAELNMKPGFETVVRAHACADAPIVSGTGRFPVIMFSHGLGHTHHSYRAIIEDLVSHGNVVVAVEHTHGGRAVQFPDGEVVKRDNSRWFTGVDPERNMMAAKEYPRFWAEDTRLVIDMLSSTSSPVQRQIQGRIDVNRLIYAGHSFGGITAVYAAMIDPRIKGAVNLDGLIVGRYPLPVTVDVPLLVLNSKDRNELPTYMSAARVLPVARSNHMTFSDFIWLHEQAGMGPPPPADMSGEQGIALTRTALRRFQSCVFEGRCQELDAQLAEIRGPLSAAPQPPQQQAQQQPQQQPSPQSSQSSQSSQPSQPSPQSSPQSAQQAPGGVRVPVEVLDRYVGEYESDAGQLIVTVRRDGETLLGQPAGAPEGVPLVPVSNTVFKVGGGAAEVEFVTDEAGVMHKILRQGGQEIRARRRQGK